MLIWIRLKASVFAFAVFFFWHMFERQTRLLFMHCSWIVVAMLDFSTIFSTSVGLVHYSLDPQPSLFSNFFIKNRSHGTIHTFKNYFATVFFSFQFQFLVFSYIQTDPVSLSLNTFPHIFSITKQKYGNSRERWNVPKSLSSWVNFSGRVFWS